MHKNNNKILVLGLDNHKAFQALLCQWLENNYSINDG